MGDQLNFASLDFAAKKKRIEEAGAHLRVLEQSVDTATSAGRPFFGMLAVFAQFETDVRRDRQAEGIANAKQAGVYTGGKPRIDRRAVLDLLEAGDGPAAAARALGVSRMSIYRNIEEARRER